MKAFAPRLVMNLALLLAGMFIWSCAESGESTNGQSIPGAAQEQAETMKIKLNVEGEIITATLADNETARDYAPLLPLTLTLKDYASTEKVSDLPRKLSTKGAPSGIDPSVGDITYYAPWGNLALFYKDFGYASGLIKLATLDSGVEAFNRSQPFEVTIELVE